MRLTNKVFLFGAAVLMTAYYWVRFVPSHWSRWSDLDRAYYLRHLPIEAGIVVLGGVILFRTLRERKQRK